MTAAAMQQRGAVSQWIDLGTVFYLLRWISSGFYVGTGFDGNNYKL